MKSLMKKSIRIIKSLILTLSITITVYAQPTDNVIAYFPFYGNVYDLSGNGKHGTVSGVTLTADQLGMANAAYSFNGVNNLIYLPATLMPSSDAFCISFWFKSQGNGNFNHQLLIDLRGQYNLFISYFPNHPTFQKAIMFNIANSSASVSCISPNNAVQEGVWTYVVANYGSNTMQLYINGVLMDSKSQTPPSAVPGYNSAIGKDYVISQNRCWFYGSFDELLIYRRSLTSIEVQALYNRGLTSNDIPELMRSTVQYSYDDMGNCTQRKVIIFETENLKSACLDSAVRAGALLPEIDKTKYEDDIANQKILIFPNPTRGQIQITVESDTVVSDIFIYLYSTSGKLLVNQKLKNNNTYLDLSNYAGGTYILKIILGGKSSEWKIIKE